jgi:hypothetical protein
MRLREFQTCTVRTFPTRWQCVRVDDVIVKNVILCMSTGSGCATGQPFLPDTPHHLIAIHR